MIKFLLVYILGLSNLFWGLNVHAIPPPPDWAKDAIWYQVFPERFRNGDPTNDPTRNYLNDPGRAPASWEVRPWTSDWYERSAWEKEVGDDFYSTVFKRRYGGDLQGVIDKLDHLVDLGVNALYFNPIFHALSLHKYDASSFHHICPHFGPDPEGDLALIEQENPIDPETWVWTAADKLFLKLLREAKSRDIRVIIDGVWNHTGVDFFAFRDLTENQRRSQFRDWFRVDQFDDLRTARNDFRFRGWHGFWQLPEFGRSADGNNLNPAVKRYIFAATKRWMDPNGDGNPADGIDGWRLDVADEIPTGFWREWHTFVRKINPEAYTSAEIWGPAANFIQMNHFNSAMNYAGFAVPVKGWIIDAAIDAQEFGRRLQQERDSYPEDVFIAMQNLVDSHDTQRVASAIVNRPRNATNYTAPDWFDYDQHDRVSPRGNRDYDVRPPDELGRKIWALVAVFQATYIGAPMIYYGTEAGMWGADDPDDRKPMIWRDLEHKPMRFDPFGNQFPEPIPVRFDEEIFQLYRTLLHLRQEHKVLRRGGFEELWAQEQTYAFRRFYEGEPDLIVVLNRDETKAVSLPFSTNGAEIIYSTEPPRPDGRIPSLSAFIFQLNP